jgi:hypothetical protein
MILPLAFPILFAMAEVGLGLEPIKPIEPVRGLLGLLGLLVGLGGRGSCK